MSVTVSLCPPLPSVCASAAKVIQATRMAANAYLLKNLVIALQCISETQSDVAPELRIVFEVYIHTNGVDAAVLRI